MSISLFTFEKWNKAIVSAATHLYTERFPSTLITALETLIKGEAAMIMLETKDQPPYLLFDQGIPIEKRGRLVDQYFTHGYLLDPFCLAVSNGLEQGFYHLSDIAPDNFFDSQYYKKYYVDVGSIENCYFIVDLDKKTKVTICLYHGDPNYRYSQQDFSTLRAVESSVQQLVTHHWEDRKTKISTPTPQSLTQPLDVAFMNFGKSILTTRELETTHLILRGHSSKSAARELNISSDTVREHRKNLYRKLNINSQAELFALFISAISAFREGSDEDPLKNLINHSE
jgi:DNA-binding CsgD family transcriptional regulator|tara:strand:+ start:1819 stop:2673 length:855 start_codon:yes stop_codon:yes gene_type:complete